MAFVAIDDVGTTVRRRLTPRRRLQVWERTGGRCVLCERKIDGARERWIAEHVRALELGGSDELDNMGPAHEACAFVKTQDDHRRAGQAKRQKIRHNWGSFIKTTHAVWKNQPMEAQALRRDRSTMKQMGLTNART